MEWDACDTPIECDSNVEGACTPYFKDATDEIVSGSNPSQRNYGIAITDVDGDGLFDAFVAAYSSPSGTPANLVLSHKDGTMKNIAASTVPDVRRKTLGVAACDIDGDGREEIYLLNLDAYMGDGGSSAARDQILSKRPGQAIFGDLLSDEKNGQVLNQASGRSVGCIDRRGNGNYSVFVSNYASNGSPKAMLVEMPTGSNTLKDVAPELGMDTANGGRAVVAGQLYDEHVSLFVNNEGGNGGNSGKNYLYKGLAGGKFEQVASERRVEDVSQTGRGTIMMDANGDGKLDLVYGNWNGYHRMFMQHADGAFIDESSAELRAPSKIRTVIAADWDNDGYEEIFFNNIPGSNRLFSVFGDADAEFAGQWKPQEAGAAEEPQGYGTGAGVADFDGDGKLELLISHGESDPNYQGVTLFRAAGGEGNHYIRIYPTTVNGAPARGALVQLTMNDGRVQTRSIDGGSGYLCAQEPVAHFGLGKETTFKTITVRWPGVAKHLVVRTGELDVDKQHTVPHPEVTGDGAFTTADPALAGGHAAIAWDGKSVADLHNEYWDIFAESGNRNAASHLWVSFLVDRGGSMDTGTFETMFSGFCPVSGSPVSNGRSPYQVEVKSAVEGKAAITGFIYFCCSPCVCDTIDLVRTDTRTVYTKEGRKTYDFLVIGDPCADVNRIPWQAPELKCKNGRLEKAIRSDNGHIIIGMLHKKALGADFYEIGVTNSDCKARADAGYPSGMGTIFREVAQIASLGDAASGGSLQTTTASSGGAKTCSNLIPESVASEIRSFVQETKVVIFGVANARCTITAQQAFAAANSCYEVRYFSAESTMWDYFKCKYPDEKVGPNAMHSYVYIGGEFVGSGFRLLQNPGDYRCTDGNVVGKGEFCLSAAGFSAKIESAGAGPCTTTATAVVPPSSATAVPSTSSRLTATDAPTSTSAAAAPVVDGSSSSSSKSTSTTMVSTAPDATTSDVAEVATPAAEPQTSIDWAIAAGLATAPPPASSETGTGTGNDANNVNNADGIPSSSSAGRKLTGPQTAGVAVGIVLLSIGVAVLRWKSMLSSSDGNEAAKGFVNPTYDSRRPSPPGTPPSTSAAALVQPQQLPQPQPQPRDNADEISC